MLSRLVVFAFEHLAERTLTNEFFKLKAEADLVARDNAIVTFVVIEAVVDETLKFSRLILVFRFGKVEDFFVLSNFSHFVIRQIVFNFRHLLDNFA